MGRLSKLKKQAINEANKRNLGLLTEGRSGLIENGDTDTCLIQCNIKHAKYGSNGEIVKKIQHLLGNNGFNQGEQGGGIKKGCLLYTKGRADKKFCSDQCRTAYSIKKRMTK